MVQTYSGTEPGICFAVLVSPWPGPFPPPTPPTSAHRRLCSQASLVIWACPTPCFRSPMTSSLRILIADHRFQPAAGCRASRFPCQKCPRMLRVYDPAGLTHLSPYRHRSCCLPQFIRRSASWSKIISGLNTWPALPPVNASRASLRRRTHDSGPWRMATPFHVRLFHPILLTGFHRRSR